MPWVYILRCADGTFYVGHTTDLEWRLKWHNDGHGSNYTARRRPVELVYTEECDVLRDVIDRERQLKRWSAQKKAALIQNDAATLRTLSRRRGRQAT